MTRSNDPAVMAKQRMAGAAAEAMIGQAGKDMILERKQRMVEAQRAEDAKPMDEFKPNIDRVAELNAELIQNNPFIVISGGTGRHSYFFLDGKKLAGVVEYHVIGRGPATIVMRELVDVAYPEGWFEPSPKVVERLTDLGLRVNMIGVPRGQAEQAQQP